MSQKKVEHYKAEKANRKKIMQKEKAKSYLARIIAFLIGLALIIWIGYSVYNTWEASRPAKSTEISVDALSDYVDGLAGTETE